MNLENLNLVELDVQEMQEIDGGILPAVAAWWAGATLLTKIGVIAGGATVVGGAAYVGYKNGYDSVN